MSFGGIPPGPPPAYTPAPNMDSFPPPPPNVPNWHQSPAFPQAHAPYPATHHPPPQLHHPQQPHQPYYHPQPHTVPPSLIPQQTQPPPPTTTYTSLEYPYLPTAKRQMTLLSPDRSTPLLTVVYPSSWSTTPKLTILHGDGSGATASPELGGALFHSITTDKADAYFRSYRYHFRKRFVSQTGLGGGGGQGKMEWAVEDGALVLSDGDKRGGGGWVARFVARDGAKVGDATGRLEGRLEVRRGGLTAEQFEEVFVTMVAEMERKRRSNEEWDIVEKVFKGMGGE